MNLPFHFYAVIFFGCPLIVYIYAKRVIRIAFIKKQAVDLDFTIYKSFQ